MPFDRPEPRIPYKVRKIEDRECFAAFGRQAAETIAPLVADPLVGSYWPLAVARSRQTDNLGACLSQSRHELEGRWGLETLSARRAGCFRANHSSGSSPICSARSARVPFGLQ